MKLVQGAQRQTDDLSVARLDWVKAAGRQRVRAAGGGERLDLPQRPGNRHRHEWQEWLKPALVQQESRRCRTCGALQTRTTKPRPRRTPTRTDAVRATPTKGRLVIRSSVGVQVVDQRDAARQARQAIGAGEARATSGKRASPARTSLTFHAGALAASGSTVVRPEGVARRGWLVARSLGLRCGTCGTDFHAVCRAEGDIVVICGGYRHTWKCTECKGGRTVGGAAGYPAPGTAMTPDAGCPDRTR